MEIINTIMTILFVLFMIFVFGGYHKNKAAQREKDNEIRNKSNKDTK